jgi:ubiquinone biosynthesis protein
VSEPADLAWGVFSDDAPWVLDDGEQAWQAHLHLVREATRRSAPELARPQKLPPLGRLATVTRHLGVGVARWALTDRRDPDRTRAGLSLRLRVAAEALGPTYIKLGQIISSGEGIFPDELVDEFKQCRDRVRAEPFDHVRRVIEEDLGAPIEAVFAEFDRTPLAAASIAQVHVARLHTGEEVVVKVQRPQVEELVQQDLKVMAWLAPLFVGRIPVAALANPPALVELFAETIVEELDFRLEAENMLDVARSMRSLGQEAYVIPRPHPELITRRVLVMERLSGFALDEVDAMKAAGVDLVALIRTGIIGFLEGAMFHGVFHGDLHGGNLFIQPDGRTALLDFGITGRLDEPRRIAFLKLLAGGSTNDVRVQLPALAELGALPLDTDFEALIAELGLDDPAVDPTQMDPDEMVGELQRVLKALLGYGARMPKELMLFVKNMAFSSSMGSTLAPDLDILDLIQQIVVHFAMTHGERIATDLQQEYDPDAYLAEVTLDGYKASLGVPDADAITIAELQERRRIIRERFAKRSRKGGTDFPSTGPEKDPVGR